MIEFLELHLVGEGNDHVGDEPVCAEVLTVAAFRLIFPALYPGQGVVAYALGDIILYALFIIILIGLKALADLIFEYEAHARINDGLMAQHILKILERYINICENFKVGAPFDAGTGIPLGVRLLDHLTVGLALFEIKRVLESAGVYLGLHVFGGILRGAQTEAVCAE